MLVSAVAALGGLTLLGPARLLALIHGDPTPSIEDAAGPPNPYSLHYQFDRLAFYPDLYDHITHDRYEYDQWPLEIVRKWASSPRACVSAPEHLGLVERLADELALLMGMAITVESCSSNVESSLVVAIAKRARLAAALAAQGFSEALERAECLALPFAEHGVIYYAYVAVPSGSPIVEHCIVHEVMHGLGLSGHAELAGPSVLGLNSSSRELSLSDRIIIRTLYDPRITPGMPRHEALAVARDVIDELLVGLERHGVLALHQRPDATAP